MLWIVREAAIYYFNHAQFKAYLPSAPNVVSLKVQFECDTLKHKQWQINQVTVHCTLVAEFLKETEVLDTSFRTIKVGNVKSIIPKLYMM